VRKRINDGDMEYIDMHLSHLAQFMDYGFLGKLNWAVIEVTAVYEDGRAIPSTSLGNNMSWIEAADRIILEVNSWQSIDLEGMHDVYYGLNLPPRREPIPLTRAGQRIGSPYLNIPINKVAAVIETNSPDRNTAFKDPDAASLKIAGHLLEFLEHEVKKGRLPVDLLQCGFVRIEAGQVPEPDGLHRGDSGRHDRTDPRGQDGLGFGDFVLAGAGYDQAGV
jgi:succinyl-CoA:acetate CoA-transferase